MNKNAFLKTARLMVFLSFLILWLGTSCQISTPSTSLSTSTPPVIFSDEANYLFFALFPNVKINSGITVERAIPALPNQSNVITFAVFNHTNESITFSNQGFKVKVFIYNLGSKLWTNLDLPHFPDPTPIVLPAKIENWRLAGQYTWTLLDSDVQGLGYEKIRIYVSGTGNITNTQYGAYFDAIITSH